ncbi:MAG: DEAD/DEAH box helicase family protein, partial [Bacteroidales bacterium]
MDFFENNFEKLKPLALNGNPIYRECQVGAAWATMAHFTSSTEPALISMPTGSGKTALMMMLAFILKAKHVIIITSSVVLRGQTAEKFKDLTDLRQAGAYPKDAPSPLVLDHIGQLTTSKAWETFLNFDVVVATPHTTSPGYEDIIEPPVGLFGNETIIFFDEAHHSRANTWQLLIRSFSNSRLILLTATPFRNDNKRLLAKLVYHYPLKKALDAGIYAPITYHAVNPTVSNKKDEELCTLALRIYKKQKKMHPKARLLIRAEGVTKSAELLQLYKNAGLNVEEVNYKQTLQENNKALEGIRSGRLDGVVCIDQIGEGLDIPNLKIAVLHKPRQSFPATVQFIGRICRESTADIGVPHLIACPDDVKGKLQKLYSHDNAWLDFIPALEKIIGNIVNRSSFHGVVDVESELDLQIEDIHPFFSVRVYKNTKKEAFRFDTKLDLPEEVVPVYQYEIQDKNIFVLITAIERCFPWVEDSVLSAPYFDLHIFYWNDTMKLLFE